MSFRMQLDAISIYMIVSHEIQNNCNVELNNMTWTMCVRVCQANATAVFKEAFLQVTLGRWEQDEQENIAEM